MRSGYNKILTVILIMIIVAVIGLLAYLGYDYYFRYRTNKDGEAFVDSLTDGVVVDAPVGDTTDVSPSITENTTTDLSTNITDDNISGSGGSSSSGSSKTKPMYKGFYTLGSIEIPKTGVKYPVLEKVTKKSLETAVAVLWPANAELNTPGNIVILGHNFRNGLFFSNNKKLSKRDKIYITDLDKKRIAYTIYKIFETSESDTKFFNRDTNGKREITLSTCTDDAKARLIIQARE